MARQTGRENEIWDKDRQEEGNMVRQTDREKEKKRAERKRYSEIGQTEREKIISEIYREREEEKHCRCPEALFQKRPSGIGTVQEPSCGIEFPIADGQNLNLEAGILRRREHLPPFLVVQDLCLLHKSLRCSQDRRVKAEEWRLM